MIGIEDTKRQPLNYSVSEARVIIADSLEKHSGSFAKTGLHSCNFALHLFHLFNEIENYARSG